MIELPAWFYLISLILCAVGCVLITRKWYAHRRRVYWYANIDRLSKYWYRRLKEEVKDCPDCDLPDNITLVVAEDADVSNILSKAKELASNSIYGLTAAKFDNPPIVYKKDKK